MEFALKSAGAYSPYLTIYINKFKCNSKVFKILRNCKFENNR